MVKLYEERAATNNNLGLVLKEAISRVMRKPGQCSKMFPSFWTFSLSLYHSKNDELKIPFMGDRNPPDHILASNEDAVIRTGLYLIDMLSRGVPWEPENIPRCCKDYGLLSIN